MDNSVIFNNNLNDEKLKVIDVAKNVYKCPDYVLRAQKNYYKKKKEEDPEYLEKRKARVNQYREANREHVNELARIRKQKKKAAEREKQEQEAKKQITKENELDLPTVEKLAI